MKALIVMGDKTDHGGTVITCSSLSFTNGKGWARVGDMVACPRCKGVFPIVQGDEHLYDNDQAVAYEGCKTACGAALQSSQRLSWTLPLRGDAPRAPDSPHQALAPGLGLLAPDLAGSYQDKPANGTSTRFRGRFRIVNMTTGAPVVACAIQIHSTTGPSVTGQTDANGYTPWVERDECEALELILLEDNPA